MLGRAQLHMHACAKLKHLFLNPPEYIGLKVALLCLAICATLVFLDYLFNKKIFAAFGFVFAFVGVIGIFWTMHKVWRG